MRRSILVVAIVVLFSVVSPQKATADLIDNLDGTVTQIKTDGSQLMWLKDANIIGMSDWSTSSLWIDSLNSSDYLGYHDWRLPVNLPVNGTNYDYAFSFDGSTDRGENIGSVYSEMAYMYYVELGNVAPHYPDGSPQPDYGLSNTGPFLNLHPQGSYWSQTEYDPDNWERARFLFSFMSGRQTVDYEYEPLYYTWAVRGAEPVPAPGAFLLGTLGLSLAGWKLRRRV